MDDATEQFKETELYKELIEEMKSAQYSNEDLIGVIFSDEEISELKSPKKSYLTLVANNGVSKLTPKKKGKK